ncbi:MAG: FAD-binding oxidoreductase [Pseudomonadota bacterium]
MSAKNPSTVFSEMFKFAVVGRGLIGSAATRHLTESTDGVVVIGPEEPVERQSHHGVFASHYDEGRMTRIIDSSPEWSIIAQRSISQYHDLERRSGVSFFTPAGYLGIGGPGQTYNDECERIGLSMGANLARLNASQIREHYPFLNVSDDADGLTESGSAGYISPRSLVKAQSILAEKGGATVVNDFAVSVSGGSRGVEITTSAGGLISAEKAIVATGAFTQGLNLSHRDLGLSVYGRTVVLARLDEALLKHFTGMPTMIHSASGAYILPPIQYPDGCHYLKIGIGTDADPRLDSPEKLDRWFKGSGSESDREQFTDILKTLFPALKTCQEWHTDTCATTYTASRLPIIDYVVKDRILIAVGGCGNAAKGSDDWGFIAASILFGHPWEHPIKREKLLLEPVDD